LAIVVQSYALIFEPPPVIVCPGALHGSLNDPMVMPCGAFGHCWPETETPPFVERKCKMILFVVVAVARTQLAMIDFEWVSVCSLLHCSSVDYQLPPSCSCRCHWKVASRSQRPNKVPGRPLGSPQSPIRDPCVGISQEMQLQPSNYAKAFMYTYTYVVCIFKIDVQVAYST